LPSGRPAQPGAEPYDLAAGVNIPMLVLHGTRMSGRPSRHASDAGTDAALGKVCTFVFYDGARHGFAAHSPAMPRMGDAEL
jgi:dienelactone hydrolase